MRLYRVALTFFTLILFRPTTYGAPLFPQDCELLFNQTRPLSEFSNQLSSQHLSKAITERRKNIPEFQFIASLAKQRGLRAWLFGGTAASYCHYVKWDLLREKGDRRFQPERFDYDYTNIYRSTQDLDIVIDGNPEQAKNFEHELKTQFPYFSGKKSTPWEVRSLRYPSQDKGGLLEDFGFMHQNTDSNSTGMVELTEPPIGQSVIRDLRDWHSTGTSQFLQDITDGTLTYYSSTRHHETPRAQAGKNPAIFGVIRALIKAFQYNLKIKPSDFEIFKQETKNFNPEVELKDPYAANWIEKNGKKLFQNSVNVEYAWNTLESLGLRTKLISIRFDEKTSQTLSWWLNKEPLRSKPVGEGNGRTARSLGLKTVAHETSDFLAYENITRSMAGIPNVFISRDKAVSEIAMFGNGFYTAVGEKGAAQTGITIRFEVDPDAREGTDFIRHFEEKTNIDQVKTGEFIIWTNKNAIKIIPESIKLTPIQYFQYLEKGEKFKSDDKAILWNFKRQLEQKIISEQISFQETEKIRKIVETQLTDEKPNQNIILSEWIRFEGIRLKIPSSQIDHWIENWNFNNFLIDPLPIFTLFTEISKNTGLENFITRHWLPKISRNLKTDVGNRVLEHCLFSELPELRNFGLRVLNEHKNNSKNLFLKALEKLYQSQLDATTWIQSESSAPEEILEKAAYLTLHPELREHLSEEQNRLIEPILKTFTLLPTFEKYLNETISSPIKAESFQFVSYEFPPNGTKILLGSPTHEAKRWYGREELHEVVLTDSFQIQATPVTQLQWTLIMGDNPSKFNQDGIMIEVNQRQIAIRPNDPIDYVSWIDAQIFIDKLNLIDPDYTYRLPTEAEWEFAARAGTKTPFSHGENINDLNFYAWTINNGNHHPHEVATLKPNSDGIYDMHGNIWEWVHDWWSETFPPFSVNPQGPPTGQERILRGGSCANMAPDSRSARRLPYHPNSQRNFAGFRLVRVAKIKN